MNEQLLWWWMNSWRGTVWTVVEIPSEANLTYNPDKLSLRSQKALYVRSKALDGDSKPLYLRSKLLYARYIHYPPWPFREMIIEADNCTVSILEIISSLFSSFTSNILLFKNYLRKSVKILSVLNNFPPKVFSFRILFVPLSRISTSAGRRLSRGFPRHCG